MTQAAMGALKKVMTMQYLGVGQLLSDAGLEWEALGSLHRTSHGHLRITLPDDVLVRTQYWDAVTLLGQVMPFAQSPPDPKTVVRQASCQQDACGQRILCALFPPSFVAARSHCLTCLVAVPVGSCD